MREDTKAFEQWIVSMCDTTVWKARDRSTNQNSTADQGVVFEELYKLLSVKDADHGVTRDEYLAIASEMADHTSK